MHLLRRIPKKRQKIANDNTFGENLVLYAFFIRKKGNRKCEIGVGESSSPLIMMFPRGGMNSKRRRRNLILPSFISSSLFKFTNSISLYANRRESYSSSAFQVFSFGWFNVSLNMKEVQAREQHQLSFVKKNERLRLHSGFGSEEK